jgi:hypothetical protein
MASKGYVPTKEHKKNLRQALKEYYLSPASQKTRRRLAEVARSRPPMSKETREKMSRSQILRHKTHPHPKPTLGKRLPQEWCSKISKGLKRYYKSHTINNKGVKHSETTRHKISVSCKENGVGTWNKGRRKKKSGKEEEGAVGQK